MELMLCLICLLLDWLLLLVVLLVVFDWLVALPLLPLVFVVAVLFAQIVRLERESQG